MRHMRKSRRFGRMPAHRKAMFDNLVTSLFLHERIFTTVAKAKELRRVAEKLVTLGKKGDLASRRIAAERLCVQGRTEGAKRVLEETALKKLFEDFARRYNGRPGGYTRIIRSGRRIGDNAPMAYIEMLPEEGKAQPVVKKGTKKTAAPNTKTRSPVAKKAAAGKGATSGAAKSAPKKAKATKVAAPKASSKEKI